MTKRVSRDIIALVGVAIFLGGFYYYVKVETRRTLAGADRRMLPPPPPVFTLRAQGPYETGREVWVELELSNKTDTELRVLELSWPGTVEFELRAPKKEPSPAPGRLTPVELAPGGRMRQRFDLSRTFELAPGEHVVQARYEAPEGEDVWTGTLVSAPVTVRVAPVRELPEGFIEMGE